MKIANSALWMKKTRMRVRISYFTLRQMRNRNSFLQNYRKLCKRVNGGDRRPSKGTTCPFMALAWFGLCHLVLCNNSQIRDHHHHRGLTVSVLHINNMSMISHSHILPLQILVTGTIHFWEGQSPRTFTPAKRFASTSNRHCIFGRELPHWWFHLHQAHEK